MATKSTKGAKSDGFALVLTLALLALLVLAVCGLSTLVRLAGRDESSGRARMQARQHALVALDVALREMQRAPGADGRVTAMAGVTGVSAAAGNSTRHWCGVWAQDGTFFGWLASGAQTTGPAVLQAGFAPIELLGNGSVGAAAANSEHVVAGRVPVMVTGPSGMSLLAGAYAYVVLDEGVKISAYSPASERIISEPALGVTSTAPTSAQGRLRAALEMNAARLPGVLSYEQLVLLPLPASPLTPSVRQDNFHHVTLTTRTLTAGRMQAGRINLNTTSAIVWRSILETYNTAPGVTPIPAGSLNARGTAIANALAASASGKAANRPFISVAAFGGSDLLAANLPAPITPEEFMTTIGPLLTVHSDTFRVRAYGEAANPADPTLIEARAWAEAMVQRLPGSPGSNGRLTVMSFRWLSPDEI